MEEKSVEACKSAKKEKEKKVFKIITLKEDQPF